MHTVVASRRSTELAFAALLIGLLMAQLDGNIVVAALPTIAGDLQTSSATSVFAVYLLAVTVTTPLHAALGDVLGRRAVFVMALVAFAGGSLVCAMAPTLGVLLAARAVQGIGGGGLVITAIAALGVMFDADERIRRQIWTTAVFAVSSLAGPPLGGLIAAGPGWRWIFAVNLPLCLLALLLGYRGVPTVEQRGRLTDFDWAGAALVTVVGAAVVVLGSLSWVATSLPATAGLIVVAGAATALFLRVERRAGTPLIPLTLFTTPVLGRAIIATGLSGVALFGTFAAIPLALTTALDTGAAATGTLLVALTGGQLLATTTFSIVARRHPQLAVWGRLALGLGAVGLLLLAVLAPLSLSAAVWILAVIGLALVGAGLGLSMQAYTLLGQATAPMQAFGAAMGTLTFARQLGGSVGAAASGWLLLGLGQSVGPSIVLAVAAVITTAAMAAAPRAHQEPSQPDGRP